ncbi:hypothetical protein M0805_006441 [Coniferiporia weirii]|nr:hypothetical protein M0805_006441 [Coniferiporia weirii]
MFSDADADGEPDEQRDDLLKGDEHRHEHEHDYEHDFDYLANPHGHEHEHEPHRHPLKIKLPSAMARSVADGHGPAGPRRSTRNRKSSDSFVAPSGSEYSARDASSSSPVTRSARRRQQQQQQQQAFGDVDHDADADADGDAEEDEDEIGQSFKVEKIEVEEYTTARGRHTTRPSYQESDDDGLGLGLGSGVKNNLFDGDEDVDLVDHTKKPTTRLSKRSLRGGASHRRVDSDDDGGGVPVGHYATRSRSKKAGSGSASHSPPVDIDGLGEDDAAPPAPGGRLTRAAARRLTRKSARQRADEGGYEDGVEHDGPGSSEDELMDDVHTTPEPEMEEDAGPRQYRLRTRKNINYAIPPPLEEMTLQPPTKGGSRPSKGKGRAGPGWSANGTELSKYMGMPFPADDSDTDVPTRTPRKPFGAGAGGGLFAAGGGGLFPDTMAAAGTPSNLGKVSDAALADADPLGVNPNVTFDEVGGLDDHINSLKEMTLLPLLYPEVFQRFNLTSPRGVLFHGPPGTGKTLLARALAASCRSNGRGISFFMRKGADCLSKWVGEAERQLRLLFEEARNQQPSIIFFDEIDGLAPVRSSKQDQIHASIVSTLLALMDGMDGRGQVIVIGATNRPDAVDPALRRPGRFDREFYFALPNFEARAKILSIITRKWEGWEDENAKETIERLAKITKGYGGADLRALCTEAALNAVQRRYPQIYKSSDRLLLKPETIGVQARDFMISVKKLVPSSARSTASSATPLPSQLVPLLEDMLQHTKQVIEKVLPLGKKRTALEEAEYEDEGDEGALEREILMQKMETLRVYRPRLVLHGDAGMGQAYIGSAALHHLEGFHIQTLDLGSLMGDSMRTIEAGIVQLFIEAKRHQPSVIYVPSLLGWCAAVSETARTTVKAMLDTLSPSDPILLLAVVDGPFLALPRDVRAWFGAIRENRVLFAHPTAEKRRKFFDELLEDVRRPPTQFPDGVPRRKRVLEELPIAPPLEPRQPTKAELALQEEKDQGVLTLLKYRLGPILAELKRKHKRFTKPARDEYNLYPDQFGPFVTAPTPRPVEAPVAVASQPNGIIMIDGVDASHPEVHVNGVHAVPPPEPQLFEVDLESINVDLYKGKYLTPGMFLDEIRKIVYNAEVRAAEDHDRLNKAQAMFTAAQVSIQEFDPGFRLECERMAGRERQRRMQRRAEKAKSRAGSREGSAGGSGLENGVAPVRRSARNNGLEPELGITDPSQLERRLKRQRSQDANGAAHGAGSGSGGGEGEREGEDGVDDRGAKRSRVGVEAVTDHDELDVLGPTSSQVRPSAVRFAPEVNDVLRTPTRMNTGDYLMADLTPTPELNNGLRRTQPQTPLNPGEGWHLAADFTPTPEQHLEPRQYSGHSGFDPNLLNPAVPQPQLQLQPQREPLPSLESLINAGTGPTNGLLADQSPLFPYGVLGQPPLNGAYGVDPRMHMAGSGSPAILDNTHTGPGPAYAIDPSLNNPALAQPQPRTPRRSPAPGVMNQQQPEWVPPESEAAPPAAVAAMEVEAPPAPSPPSPPPPPPPTFHVDETLLAELETRFVDRTAQLSVEQLEQLRAASLGCIWCHRQEWDRDACVGELFGVIEEFVEEAGIEDMD